MCCELNNKMISLTTHAGYEGSDYCRKKPLPALAGNVNLCKLCIVFY